ncbi:hypothetical protein ACS0TY_033565 [Phlomoides rotata]
MPIRTREFFMAERLMFSRVELPHDAVFETLLLLNPPLCKLRRNEPGVVRGGAHAGPLPNIAHKEVDVVYAPFIERFHIFFNAVWKIDITSDRPKLDKWIEVL